MPLKKQINLSLCLTLRHAKLYLVNVYMCLVSICFLITRALQCKYLPGAGQVALLSLSCVPVFGQGATQLCLSANKDAAGKKYWVVPGFWGTAVCSCTHPYCTRDVGIDSQAEANTTDGCGSWQFWSMARVYALGCLIFNPIIYHITSQREDAIITFTRLTVPTHGDKFYIVSSISASSSLTDITLLTLFDRNRLF